MAVIEKKYALAPAVVLNVVNDIAEMRKAPLKREDGGLLVMDTEMYGIKTVYIFRITSSSAGTTVAIETDGESENDERRVRLMFATLDNMLGPFLG